MLMPVDEDRCYSYDEEAMAAAWRLFVNTGTVDEDVVRPMVARSWIRCRAAGVNPWSSDFPPLNERLLAEKCAKFSHSIEANEPVMQVLLALLKCNVSLMDQENFVFMFMTPLPHYPRTLGSYQHENLLGTGNSTVVAYERCPVRIEGFETYRSVSQGYSGVSAPYLDVDGEYFGAMNLNSPFGPLPPQALEMCASGVDLVGELFLLGHGMWHRLRSVEFFQPLVDLMPNPVVFLDTHGRILLANKAMSSYVPGYDNFSYGSQSLSAYLDTKKTPLKSILADSDEGEIPRTVFFKPSVKRRTVKELQCSNKSEVRFRNGLHFLVLVFDELSTQMAQEKIRVREYTRPCAVSNRFVDDERVDYIGESDEWKAVDRIVDRISSVNANAFILGETGTGKELVARAIHNRSGRPGSFVVINCGAIPRDLFAAELFGYESGAFTGAKEGGSVGKIEAADHGTVLLDEIGEMPLDLQVGLLRVIQEREVTRLGATESKPLDVRFLAATNQNIAQMIETREFRADLYYRLSSIEINLPPLRNRIDDVPLLAEYFNKCLSKALCLEYSPFNSDVLDALTFYAWPGNVRELRNAVERCLILAGTGGKVTLEHLPAHIVNAGSISKAFVPAVYTDALTETEKDAALRSQKGGSSQPIELSDFNKSGLSPQEADERERISRLLLEANGNLSKTASALGVSRTTLYKRLKYYRLRLRLVVEIDD